jgi:hypothetical protein
VWVPRPWAHLTLLPPEPPEPPLMPYIKGTYKDLMTFNHDHPQSWSLQPLSPPLQ